MTIKLKVPLPLAFLVLSMGFSAIPMQAQWAVFDASSWAAIGQVWNEDISTNLKLAQTVAQGGQMIQNGLQIYNLAMRETTALRNKQFMQAAGVLSTINIPGHADWTLVLRSAGGPLAAAGAWQAMTKPGVTLANRIQLADAFGTSMASALGSCQAAALQNDGAIGQLESIALSMDTLDNTRAALGGLTNMGMTQQLRIQQCQHTLQQQQVQAQMLQIMRARDYDNDQITTQQNVISIAAANPRGVTNLMGLRTADFN